MACVPADSARGCQHGARRRCAAAAWLPTRLCMLQRLLKLHHALGALIECACELCNAGVLTLQLSISIRQERHVVLEVRLQLIKLRARRKQYRAVRVTCRTTR